METIVISLGGSVIFSDEANADFLHQLATLLKKLSKTYKLFIIVGGGPTARCYIEKGRTLAFNEEILDEIGIAITRVNAKLLTQLVGIANTSIPSTTDTAKHIDKPIVIMGGTTPGHSTDMVGVELAEKTHANRYIIATNVDGIYDKDPNKHSDAQQLTEVSIDKLIETYGTQWDTAGKNVVIDGPALQIIKQVRIPTFVVNGKRLDQLEKAITQQPFDGTTINV
jgi:uridylate kinase